MRRPSISRSRSARWMPAGFMVVRHGGGSFSVRRVEVIRERSGRRRRPPRRRRGGSRAVRRPAPSERGPRRTPDRPGIRSTANRPSDTGIRRFTTWRPFSFTSIRMRRGRPSLDPLARLVGFDARGRLGRARCRIVGHRVRRGEGVEDRRGLGGGQPALGDEPEDLFERIRHRRRPGPCLPTPPRGRRARRAGPWPWRRPARPPPGPGRMSRRSSPSGSGAGSSSPPAAGPSVDPSTRERVEASSDEPGSGGRGAIGGDGGTGGRGGTGVAGRPPSVEPAPRIRRSPETERNASSAAPSPTTITRRPARPSLRCGSSLVRSPETVRASTRRPAAATTDHVAAQRLDRVGAAAAERAVEPDVAARRLGADGDQAAALDPDVPRDGLRAELDRAGQLEEDVTGDRVDVDATRGILEMQVAGGGPVALVAPQALGRRPSRSRCRR